MTTSAEIEALNIIAPLHNSAVMVNQASVRAVPSATNTKLTTLFGTGAVRAGHYLTLMADGAKCYVAFGAVGATGSPQTGIIDETVPGNGTTQCWPLPDGLPQSFRMVSGREVGTMIGASLMVQQLYETLHYKSAATCMLHMYWSSVVPGQGSEQFLSPP